MPVGIEVSAMDKRIPNEVLSEFCNALLAAFPAEPRPHAKELGFDHKHPDLGSFICPYDKRAVDHRELSCDFYRESGDEILCLDGKALAYFLPGLLRCFLSCTESWYTDRSVLSMFTFRGAHKAWLREKLALLNRDQLSCIERFLTIVIESNDAETSEDAQVALESLRAEFPND